MPEIGGTSLQGCTTEGGVLRAAAYVKALAEGVRRLNREGSKTPEGGIVTRTQACHNLAILRPEGQRSRCQKQCQEQEPKVNDIYALRLVHFLIIFGHSRFFVLWGVAPQDNGQR